MSVSRRTFIKDAPITAAACIASLGISGCRGRIKHRKLGRTGIRASVIHCGGLPDKEMYKIAITAGINYWHKMGKWGEPEIFGKMDRDSFYCDITIDSTDKKGAIEEFERALKRSGLSMIDGFKVHSVYEFPEEIKTKTGMLEAYETLKKQKKHIF